MDLRLAPPPLESAANQTEALVRTQVAALPYRRRGELEILLVTSRETRRWVLPKGWPMKRRTPQGAAAREALEEAGIKGSVADQPFGAYDYLKRAPGGELIPCHVEVFPLRVKRLNDIWLEAGQRTRRWFTVAEAIDAVEEPGLKALIEAFGLEPAVKRPKRDRPPNKKKPQMEKADPST
jgi:8-oxo-dGTP pyrophosphatase MutT (NUDIX family)